MHYSIFLTKMDEFNNFLFVLALKNVHVAHWQLTLVCKIYIFLCLMHEEVWNIYESVPFPSLCSWLWLNFNKISAIRHECKTILNPSKAV